jgi:hypothetical protein
MKKGREGKNEEDRGLDRSSRGMVVRDGQAGISEESNGPRIAAFIWGGKVRPTPTLPFGRWKGAA